MRSQTKSCKSHPAAQATRSEFQIKALGGDSCGVFEAAVADGGRDPLPETILTPREVTVFEMFGDGLKTSEIATRLSVSVKTIESHRENIKLKLRLSSSQQIIATAACWNASRRGVQTASRMTPSASLPSEQTIPAALLAQVYLGSWRWDIEPDIVRWSAELYRIFGFDPSLLPPSFAEYPKIYSPASFRELESCMRQCLATGEPFAVSLDAIRRDGNPIFLEVHGAACRGEDGNISYLFGVTLDRTVER